MAQVNLGDRNVNTWLLQSLLILATLALVLLNSFFVAAEFALVKVRGGNHRVGQVPARRRNQIPPRRLIRSSPFGSSEASS